MRTTTFNREASARSCTPLHKHIDVWYVQASLNPERALLVSQRNPSSLRAGTSHSRTLVIADDNFHLRSMRRELYALAGAHRSAVVFLHVITPLEESISRNARRPTRLRVPDETIRRMAAAFEPPGGNYLTSGAAESGNGGLTETSIIGRSDAPRAAATECPNRELEKLCAELVERGSPGESVRVSESLGLAETEDLEPGFVKGGGWSVDGSREFNPERLGAANASSGSLRAPAVRLKPQGSVDQTDPEDSDGKKKSLVRELKASERSQKGRGWEAPVVVVESSGEGTMVAPAEECWERLWAAWGQPPEELADPAEEEARVKLACNFGFSSFYFLGDNSCLLCMEELPDEQAESNEKEAGFCNFVGFYQ
jgi:hypothetical protein